MNDINEESQLSEFWEMLTAKLMRTEDFEYVMKRTQISTGKEVYGKLSMNWYEQE